MLKTLELRFGLDPLTARDKAAPDLGDMLTLATPRQDDPLQGVEIPVSNPPHPAQSEPSVIDKLHAHKVSLLPLRNEQGSYDRHTPPDLSSSEQIGDYIQGRTVAWHEHLARRCQRRARRKSVGRKRASPAKKAAPKKAKGRKRRS